MFQSVSASRAFPRRIVAQLCCGLLLLTMSGCAMLRPELQPPQATLVAVELTELGVRQQRFRLVIDLDNPNTIALPVNALAYSVVLDGAPFADGRTEGSFRVPAGGRERVRLSVSTDLLRSLEQLQGLLVAGRRDVGYELDGRVWLDMPMRPSLRFSDRGSIDIDF
ncbi:MAG: LEA type 2 family protein [Gammaproteobacteria bacterium]|nr:LEA type 2 family protein [Gammaproteobacteria bacterium]